VCNGQIHSPELMRKPNMNELSGKWSKLKATVKQIVKEFWLPLLSTIAWTFFTVSTDKSQTWTFAKVTNVAGPTFFLISWMTGQYFRVRKQEHVSDSLSSITGRVEAQTRKLSDMVTGGLVQTFDECIYALKDAKEELADVSRKIKTRPDIDPAAFELNRGSPFYQPRRYLDVLVGYAGYATTAVDEDIVRERFTRCSYHIEELGGHVGNFIARLEHHGVAWKTERSRALVIGIASAIERFETEFLPYSRYDTEPYKGTQNLRTILRGHVARLRTAIT